MDNILESLKQYASTLSSNPEYVSSLRLELQNDVLTAFIVLALCVVALTVCLVRIKNLIKRCDCPDYVDEHEQDPEKSARNTFLCIVFAIFIGIGSCIIIAFTCSEIYSLDSNPYYYVLGEVQRQVASMKAL